MMKDHQGLALLGHALPAYRHTNTAALIFLKTSMHVLMTDQPLTQLQHQATGRHAFPIASLFWTPTHAKLVSDVGWKQMLPVTSSCEPHPQPSGLKGLNRRLPCTCFHIRRMPPSGVHPPLGISNEFLLEFSGTGCTDKWKGPTLSTCRHASPRSSSFQEHIH
eukprot:418601-Pelagomonas_calceolata.AAC.4